MEESVQTVQLYASDVEISKVWKAWSVRKRCVICDKVYNLLGSFGKWDCSYHPKPPSAKRVLKKGVFDSSWGYWDCCKEKLPIPHHAPMENVWQNIRITHPYKDRFFRMPNIEGCIQCDHRTTHESFDDGFRNNIEWKKIAPEGGWKIGDEVLVRGHDDPEGGENTFHINSVNWDFSATVDGLNDTIVPSDIFPTKESINKWKEQFNSKEDVYLHLNSPNETKKCKIKKIYRNTLAVEVLEIGVPLNEIAAMIPYMQQFTGESPMNRPGFQNMDKKFPYIQRVKMRTKF